MFHLKVHDPFEGRAKGELITDQADVERILAGPLAHHVVKTLAPVEAPAPPAPAPEAAEEPAN